MRINKKFSSKQYHYSAEGGISASTETTLLRQNAYSYQFLRQVLGVGEGQAANL